MQEAVPSGEIAIELSSEFFFNMLPSYYFILAYLVRLFRIHGKPIPETLSDDGPHSPPITF